MYLFLMGYFKSYYTSVVVILVVVTMLFGVGKTLSIVDACDIHDGEDFIKPPETIYIDNYREVDVQHYPLALIQGRYLGRGVEYVVVENCSSSLPSRFFHGRIVSGSFKVLVELLPGENLLAVLAGNEKKNIKIIYKKNDSAYVVRLVYFVDSEELIKHEDFAQKLRVASLLWQTATAECFYNAGLERKTFTLEFDENDNVLVWVQRGKKKASEYNLLSEKEQFKAIYSEILSGNIGSSFAKYFVLVSFSSRFYKTVGDGERRKFALGGGAMGMLDASSFDVWPNSINSVQKAWDNNSPIAEERLYDSAYRNSFWALTSSALGSGMHELGHALGLDHVKDPNDFMSRGFDKFNRIFTVFEISPQNEVLPFNPDDCAKWGKDNIIKLLQSPWISH